MVWVNILKINNGFRCYCWTRTVVSIICDEIILESFEFFFFVVRKSTSIIHVSLYGSFQTLFMDPQQVKKSKFTKGTGGSWGSSGSGGGGGGGPKKPIGRVRESEMGMTTIYYYFNKFILLHRLLRRWFMRKVDLLGMCRSLIWVDNSPARDSLHEEVIWKPHWWGITSDIVFWSGVTIY